MYEVIRLPLAVSVLVSLFGKLNYIKQDVSVVVCAANYLDVLCFSQELTGQKPGYVPSQALGVGECTASHLLCQSRRSSRWTTAREGACLMHRTTETKGKRIVSCLIYTLCISVCAAS